MDPGLLASTIPNFPGATCDRVWQSAYAQPDVRSPILRHRRERTCFPARRQNANGGNQPDSGTLQTPAQRYARSRAGGEWRQVPTSVRYPWRARTKHLKVMELLGDRIVEVSAVFLGRRPAAKYRGTDKKDTKIAARLGPGHLRDGNVSATRANRGLQVNSLWRADDQAADLCGRHIFHRRCATS